MKKIKPKPGIYAQIDRDYRIITIYELREDGRRRHVYEIDLSRLNTPAQVMDMVFQINHKPWASPGLIGLVICYFAAACDVVFGETAQAKFCPCGKSKTVRWPKLPEA